MTPQAAERHLPRPSRGTLVLATFVSQLLGALVFSLAAFWLLVLGDQTAVTFAALAFGAVYVFAGGMAYRGSVNALGICALLDVVVGIACITKPFAVKTLLVVPALWVRPALAHDLVLTMMTVVGLAALAGAAACIAAVPQTRRFVAWRNSTLTGPVSGSLHPS